MKLTPMILPVLAAICLFSCKKNNQPHISYALKTANPSSITARTTGTVTWTSGTARATEIKFEAENQTSEVEYKSTAVQEVNLFGSLSTIGNVQIPAGTYKEVEFKIAMLGSGSIPALELKGNYNGTPIIFQVNDQFEIESEKANVTITDAGSYTAITTIDLSHLTMGIRDAALQNATRDSNGQILISSTSNADLYSMMFENLKEIKEAEVD